jgi:hypothetical protein
MGYEAKARLFSSWCELNPLKEDVEQNASLPTFVNRS